MANYTKLTDNGQIEIDWNALELTEEQIVICKAGVNKLIEKGHVITEISKYDNFVEFFLKDERYFEGEVIYGSYTIVTYFYGRDEVCFDTFGKSDLEKFGYVKEGK